MFLPCTPEKETAQHHLVGHERFPSDFLLQVRPQIRLLIYPVQNPKKKANKASKEIILVKALGAKENPNA